VQKVREAANRMACTNNLKQIGLAMHNFADAHDGRFPPARVTGPPAWHAWGPFVLPYLEQKNLCDQYRWDVDGADQRNQPAVSTHVKVFQCPSAKQDRFMTFGGFGTYGGKAACGDYAPTEGVASVLATMGLIPQAPNYDGVMVQDVMTPLGAITDGTTNTILVTECAGRPQVWRLGRPGPDQTVNGGPWAGYHNALTVQGSQRDGQAGPGSCAINCTNDHEVYSFHPGGANAVFADGSVHFLKADISIGILAALVTRAGGEVVSASDY
jgi:prepilin-type processing-associated H-X9-DG protein